MKTKIIYVEEENKFYTVPQHTSEELSKLSTTKVARVLDSPESVRKYKQEVFEKYGLHC